MEAVACCAPLGAPTLDEREAEATAELFRALGDPARVLIVNWRKRREHVDKIAAMIILQNYLDSRPGRTS